MTSTKIKKVLLTIYLNCESDVLLARRRARQIALLLGFSAQDQTRISTAVSEVVRNSHTNSKAARVDFCIEDRRPPYAFTIIVENKGPADKADEFVAEPEGEFSGLNGARHLVDDVKVSTTVDGGTIVQLQKTLAARSTPFSNAEIDQLANSLTKMAATTPLDEIYQQNQELLAALDQLNKQKMLLDQLNLELSVKNTDMARLYSELQLLNDSLEQKVLERTSELEDVNTELVYARDEAIRVNELKSQFVANISHEIRTPMSGILGLSELLINETEGETKTTAQYVLDSASSLMHIVNDLLDMSKLEAGKFEIVHENFELEPILCELAASFQPAASEKNLQFSYAIDESIPQVLRGAGGRIRQVLQNLIQNAIKFTDKGTVHLEVIEQKREAERVYLRFSVSDTGPGISSENQKKLFQLFVQIDGSTTRKHGGTGLGLALSKKLVQQMNGVINVDSIVGQGSTFWFTVPLEWGSNHGQ